MGSLVEGPSAERRQESSKAARARFAVTLTVLLGVALAGCGSTHHPSIADLERHYKLPPGGDEPAAQTTTVSDPATPDANRPPAFTIINQASKGDVVKIEGRFGAIVPATQSDADPSALKECQSAAVRNSAVELDLTATIQSSLPATVSLLKLGGDTWSSHQPNLILESSSGGYSCQITGDEEVTFGGLSPHQPAHITIWLILPETITPNDPEPSPRTLTGDWRLAEPEVSISEDPTSNQTATGPQLVVCRNYPSGVDQFIAITAQVPQKLKNVNGETETDCATQ